LFFGTSDSKKGRWRDDPNIADALSRVVGLIGEVAFSDHPLTKQRQEKFLRSFYETVGGKTKATNPKAADIAIEALMAMQASGLAEVMVPLLKEEPGT
jgi:hypothetical protein